MTTLQIIGIAVLFHSLGMLTGVITANNNAWLGVLFPLGLATGIALFIFGA